MHDHELLDEFNFIRHEGGVCDLDFDLVTPAAMIDAAERELADEDERLDDADIASIALRRWEARVRQDVILIERLADADFTITYHPETGTSPNHRDGSVSLTASMWFTSIEEADAALLNFGAEGRWASFTPLETHAAEKSSRFIVGLGALSIG